MPTEPATETQILREYPQLRCLVVLRDRGWTFRPVLREGELVALTASRSHRDHTDALWLDGHHIGAARVVDDGRASGCVWTMHSTNIEEVVHDLLALAAHGEPGAPRLIVADHLPWH